MIKGKQSIAFKASPYIEESASVVGKKEGEGPLGSRFDMVGLDDMFGEDTWEKAESSMQKEACQLALGKAHLTAGAIRYLFGGDLLRQGVATSLGVEQLQIPMFGLYGACSTSGEALALASMCVAAGYGERMLVVTSSHFGSAEKEFRFPLSYANQRPLSAQWTVTGSGAFIVGKNRSHVRITGVTVGSFAGAQKLANFGINTIGLPGTIDLDIACTEYTIGFDTAVNTAMQAIDKVRDTSTSHERCSIIEVMGRDAGYLALWCGIANGAEKILMPEEHDYDEEKIIEDIQESRKRGKKNYIIINAEGVGDSMNMAKRIEEATGMETRATILGHMQRGGSPTCKDRVYASIMGAKAVDLLLEGKTNRVVGYKHGEYVDFDIDEALGMTKGIPAYQYEIAKELAL